MLTAKSNNQIPICNEHTDTYAQLCQEAGHLSKINECILRPDICGAGKCIDTPDGYKCECKPGYDVGPTGICEGDF